MSSEKADAEHEVQHVANIGTEQDVHVGDLANLEEHRGSPLQAIRRRPFASAWTLFAVFACLLVSFENQAAGMVLAIPRFRQDFGHPHGDDFVLDADWQSAFYGGPIAAAVLGTFAAGYIADKTGRKPVILVSLALSFAAIAIEFVATTNAMFFGGKFMNGFVAGVILSVAVTYIGEVYLVQTISYLSLWPTRTAS